PRSMRVLDRGEALSLALPPGRAAVGRSPVHSRAGLRTTSWRQYGCILYGNRWLAESISDNFRKRLPCGCVQYSGQSGGIESTLLDTHFSSFLMEKSDKHRYG